MGSPSSSASCSYGTSRTRPTLTPSTTWKSRAASSLAMASTSMWSGSSQRSAAVSPSDPTLPIPSNAHWMPLASLVQVPFLAVLGPTAIGVGTAVRADRLPGGADDMGDGTGRQGIGFGRGRGRPPGGDPRHVGRVHGPARQLLALPAARPRRPLDGRPRAKGVAARIRCSRPPRRARNAVAQRRAARARRPRLHVPLGPLAASRDPLDGGRRVCSAIRPGHGAVVAPPARGLRLDLAIDGLGKGAIHPRHRRVEQHHDPSDPRAPAGRRDRTIARLAG